MIDVIVDALAGLSDGWKIFFLSMLPVTELRVALPLGIAWGMPAVDAFLWAIAGNFVPIIPLLLLLNWIFKLLSRISFLRRPVMALEAYGLRNEDKVKRWGWLGLLLLVAIPLPGTGVWTGCLVASLMRLDFCPALSAITLGEVIAGLVVALVSHSVISVGGEYALFALIAVLLLATVIVALRRHK